MEHQYPDLLLGHDRLLGVGGALLGLAAVGVVAVDLGVAVGHARPCGGSCAEPKPDGCGMLCSPCMRRARALVQK